jgi:hypothetical protein
VTLRARPFIVGSGVAALAWLGAIACGTPPAPPKACTEAPRIVTVETPREKERACETADAGMADAATATLAADAAPPLAHALVVDVGPTKLKNGQVLRGPCVTPAVHAAQQRAYASAKNGSEGAPLDEEFFTIEDLDLDLDDDGVADIFLFAGAERTTTEHEIYLRRGACGYPLGHLESAGPLELLPARSHGLHDLRAMQELCPGIKTRFCEVIHRFDGERYRVLRRAALPGARSLSVSPPF